MFTGIVEELGEVVRLDWHGEGAVLGVRGPTVTADAAAGDSIAVNGVCLTVVDGRRRRVHRRRHEGDLRPYGARLGCRR